MDDARDSIMFLAILDHYECFASSVSVPFVFGECAMRSIVFYSFDCITLFNFTDILLRNREIGRDATDACTCKLMPLSYL